MMVKVHVMPVKILIDDSELIETLLRSCTELVVVVVEDIVAVRIVVLVRAGIETSKGRHSSSHRRRRRVRSGCRCCWWERSDLIRPYELLVRCCCCWSGAPL